MYVHYKQHTPLNTPRISVLPQELNEGVHLSTVDVCGEQFGVVVDHGSERVLGIGSKANHALHHFKVVLSNELLG